MAEWLTVAEIEAKVRAAAANPDNLCTVDECPNKTVENRSVVFARITHPSTPLTPRTAVLISGGVHAREWAPPDALVSFIAKLLATHGTNPARYNTLVQNSWAAKPIPGGRPMRYPAFSIPADAVRNIVERLELFIAPLINPDGRQYSRRPVANQRWWRKNRAPTAFIGPCVDSHTLDQSKGVDINRNFNIVWDMDRVYAPGYAAGKLRENTTTLMCAGDTPGKRQTNETFRGDAVESEVETKNLKWLQEKNIELFLDVHSFGPTIMYPWGIAETNQSADRTKNFLNPDLDGLRDAAYGEYIPTALEGRLKTIAGRMQDGIMQTQTLDLRLAADQALLPKNRRFSAEYVVKQSADMYPTVGACDDFHFSRQFSISGPSNESTPVAPERVAFTVECGSEGQEEFWPSHDHEFPKIEREIHAAIWSFLSYAAAPFRAAASNWPIVPGP